MFIELQPSHLEGADAQLRLLAKDHLLSGLGEEQDAHILSMVHQELSFLVSRAPGSRLDLLLTYKKYLICFHYRMTQKVSDLG